MIDPHRLRVFRAVVASGSIRGAASNLGYTASAVSQQVAALQKDTGLTLMTRSGRGIEPTRDGLELAELATQVLSDLDHVERRVRDLRESRAGSLTVAYFSSVGTAWMPPVVKALTQKFPQVRPQLILDEVSAVESDDAYDLRIVVQEPDFVPPAGMTAELLLTEPYLAVLPPGHRLTGEDEVDLVDLAEEEWISNDLEVGWCHRNLMNSCAAAGFQPHYSVAAPEHPTALAFVAIGAGITVLPQLCLRALPPEVSTVRLRNPSPERHIYAVTGSTHQQPAVQLALRQLRRVATRSPEGMIHTASQPKASSTSVKVRSA